MNPLRLAGLTFIAWGFVACAQLPPAPGLARTELLRTWGPPTARYTLEGGLERLEYASGPYGRTTWMMDIDVDGRLTQARQVLNESEFLAVQSAPGLRRDGLLRWLGTPGERRHGGWAGGEVWSWRYPTNDCLWFQASVADDGRVTGAAYGTDPRCDAPSDARN
ncbi:MAG: hypothetical protein JNK55_17480 [Rubrivivax sp.]|nr:hypothetical protein [Rubrivivax sp.]